nr:hypothetical protein [Tanacetum cinerariifolium]
MRVLAYGASFDVVDEYLRMSSAMTRKSLMARGGGVVPLMTRNKLITDRDGFLESVRNRFGPSKYEDPHGILSKLLETGTVAQYQGEFEKLMNRVTDISETLLISFYISGLKPNLQRELLVAKPATLREVFALVRVMEARLMDQQSRTVIITTATSIMAEHQERLNKGLCFNCDNKWARGHKCPGKILLLMAEDSDVTGQDMEADATDAVENGDISILNSLIGHESPRSLQLWGIISLGEGMVMEVDLYVLPMKGPDVVLGIKWLQNLGKVTHDYAKQTMEFTLVNTKYSLQGDESLRMKKISLHHMQALLETEGVYATLEYMGHIISRHGVEMDPKKVSAKNGFKLGDHESEAFEALKQQLSTTLVLVLADFEKKFTVETDASRDGIELKEENRTLEELLNLHPQLDIGDAAAGFRREGGLVIFHDRYFIGMYSKLKSMLLREFHNTPIAGHRGVKRMLEQYLRAMVTDRPDHWVGILPWPEYCYNTSYHSGIKMSSYQALYGKVLLSIIPCPPGSSKVAAVKDVLVERDELLHRLRDNLLATKNRMEEKANLKRCEVEFNMGDKVAYLLALPLTSKIHPVFHVSILKPFLRSGSEAVAEIPREYDEGFVVEQPFAVCGSQFVLRGGSLIK